MNSKPLKKTIRAYLAGSFILPALVLALILPTISLAMCNVMRDVDELGATRFICAGTHNDGRICEKTIISNSDCKQRNDKPCFTCE